MRCESRSQFNPYMNLQFLSSKSYNNNRIKPNNKIDYIKQDTDMLFYYQYSYHQQEVMIYHAMEKLFKIFWYYLKLQICRYIHMSQESQFSEESNGGWIQWFINLQDHQFFCQVDQQYIRDSFNLYGIKQQFKHYEKAMEMILKPQPPEEEELEDQKFLEIYQQATDIYGLIHARFILTPKGLALMRQKYLLGKFGICPRVLCEKQNVIPIGMSQQIRTARVKVYCPRCEDVYLPKKKYPDVDGAYFGTSFPQIFLLSFEDLIPTNVKQTEFVPKIYGFKLYKKKGSRFTQKKINPELLNSQYTKKVSVNKKKPQQKEKKDK